MLTPEQQAALGGYRPQDRPQLPPPSGSTFRPFPGEMGRPGSITPGMTSPRVNYDGLMWLFLGFL